jgi:hypothetical protein
LQHPTSDNSSSTPDPDTTTNPAPPTDPNTAPDIDPLTLPGADPLPNSYPDDYGTYTLPKSGTIKY